MKTSPKDPRVMVQRHIDEKGEWRVLGPEGVDNDKDGKINEDPPGSARSVSNRNYPAYWAPEWVQSGSGPYPLSGGWWRAEVQRDYYFAEMHSGELFWIFYDRRRRRWFLQGSVS